MLQCARHQSDTDANIRTKSQIWKKYVEAFFFYFPLKFNLDNYVYGYGYGFYKLQTRNNESPIISECIDDSNWVKRAFLSSKTLIQIKIIIKLRSLISMWHYISYWNIDIGVMVQMSYLFE